MPEVGKWGFKVPISSGGISGGTLAAAVSQLNAKTKQAMYTAASKREIRRGTWTGCAFNAAGKEEGVQVSSTVRAAQVFDLPETTVSNFISAWDSLSSQMDDAEATHILMDLLSQDLHSSPSNNLNMETGMFQVYKSTAEQIAEFEAQFDNDSVPLTDEAAELLCVL